MAFLSEKNPGTVRQSPAGYHYYLPAGLQQISGAIVLSPSVSKQMQDAALALGEFSSLIKRLPNADLFIRAYTKKEAVLSSRIEGTQADISDAFKEESEVAVEKRDDWGEVNAYIRAMNTAIERLNTLPVCNRLITQTHKILLSQTRGKNKAPGEFRISQNWIGGSHPNNAHFVPPSPECVADLMGDLEKFIQHKSHQLPELISAALIHYQFETIHPFLDGNGRLGRMLISLYLLERGILTAPILYISTFLEKKRKNYYAALDKAREGTDGLLKWVSFFLDAVEHTAKDGISVTQQIIKSQDDLKNKVAYELGKKSEKGHQLLDHLYHNPVISAKEIQEGLSFSPQVSHSLLQSFMELNILTEVTGQKRNRLFVFDEYFSILRGEMLDDDAGN